MVASPLRGHGDEERTKEGPAPDGAGPGLFQDGGDGC